MYKQLPLSCYPKTLYIAPAKDFSEVENMVLENRITYPLAVKPDAGMMGFLFRKINNSRELKYYHERMPVDYLVQELIDYPLEVSVFYYRLPHLEKGVITGFLKKELLEVEGDGKLTLRELLYQLQARPGFKIKEYLTKHADRLDDVIPDKEIYRLSWVANLSRGGKLVNLQHEIDDRLLNIFDQLSHHAGHFYYGRYDIKCASIEALKKGEDFSILEFNGSGAEPHHIYSSGNTLFQAYSIVIQHWKVLYQISKINNDRGFRYWKFSDGLKFIKQARKHFNHLKKLDLEMP
jgi:hypothetical protein